MFKVIYLIGICVQEKGEVLVVEIMYGGVLEDGLS